MPKTSRRDLRDLRPFLQEMFSMTITSSNLKRYRARLDDWLVGVKAIAQGAVPASARSGDSAVSDAAAKIHQRVEHFEDLAALSGRFAPDQLFAKDDSEEVRQTVLTHVLASHAVETRDGELRWLLLPERRRTALGRLIASAGLTRRLREPLPKTDLYGDLLRKVLRQEWTADLREMSSEEIRTLKGIVDDLQGVAAPLPDRGVILHRLQEADPFLEEYAVVVKDFVGRAKELSDLSEFLGKRGKPRTLSSLVVTGLGGAGKSALLAKFTLEVVRKERATVVVLDFDRPGIDAADTNWLQSEIARQIGAQYPDVEETLRQARAEANRVQAAASRMTQSSDESKQIGRSSGDLLDVVHSILRRFSTRPLLLVLDTLEEITGSFARFALLEWLDLLAEVFHPTPVKAIFAGRLFDEALDFFRNRHFQQVVTLDEFPPQADAQNLLEKLNVAPPGGAHGGIQAASSPSARIEAAGPPRCPR